MDIRKAELPYKVLRGRGGTEVSEAELVAELAAADAVCIGEQHDNPHHHWAQLMILEKLSAAAGETRALAVGFEMFQTPFQGVLDDFAGGKIDERTLLARSGWEERWGYPFSFYRPMLERGVASGHPLLALNAPKELTRKIARDGLEALSPEEKKQLPELDLQDADHRAWFKEATDGHGGPAEQFENFYTAQVVWDETMADTAWRWLSAGADSRRRQVVILAGVGHCHDSGVPRRLARRGAGKAISVQPVLDKGDGEVAAILASPENDYLIVLDVKAHMGGEPSPHAPHQK